MRRCLVPRLAFVAVAFAMTCVAITLAPSAAHAAGAAAADAATAAAAVSPSPLWAGLESGPHAVGFQVLERRDPARPYRYPFDLDGKPRTIDVARPLQIGVWYPAQAGSGAAMRLADYVALMGSEQDFTLPAAERARRGEAAYFAFELARPASAEQRAQLLALPTAAHRDAKPAAGKLFRGRPRTGGRSTTRGLAGGSTSKFPVILW